MIRSCRKTLDQKFPVDYHIPISVVNPQVPIPDRRKVFIQVDDFFMRTPIHDSLQGTANLLTSLWCILTSTNVIPLIINLKKRALSGIIFNNAHNRAAKSAYALPLVTNVSGEPKQLIQEKKFNGNFYPCMGEEEIDLNQFLNIQISGNGC